MKPTCDRVVDKIDFTAGECWVWVGAGDGQGYGILGIDKRQRMAHRIVFELLVGPIPGGLEIDHLCRNRSCVNPAHLEPVTHHENMMRGLGVGSENASKTHCKHGHPFDRKNTYRRPSGRRDCRACLAERGKRYLRNKKKAA